MHPLRVVRCPEPGVLRTLTLVSICIQNLANGVEFGAKHPHLVGMNPFLARNRGAMQRCVRELSTWPVPKAEDALVTESHVDEARSYAGITAPFALFVPLPFVLYVVASAYCLLAFILDRHRVKISRTCLALFRVSYETYTGLHA